MSKIIILILLVSLNTTVANAQQMSESRSDDIPTETSNSNGDGNNVVPEKEPEEVEPTEPSTRPNAVLPPIPKPDFLPGPDFNDNTDGNSVVSYITTKFLPAISKRFITIIAVISLIVLTYSGVLFFTALGEEDKVTKARKAAIFAVVGLIIAILSFTIVQILNLLPIGT